MKMTYKIARTELQTLFYSPIAWLILIVFTIQASIAFTDALESLVYRQALGFSLNNVSIRIFAHPRSGVFTIVQQYLYLYIPLLTMGLMSKEISSGSIKLLYSSPVNNRQIILGKYLSMVIYALIITGILFLFTLYGAFTVDNFDIAAVCSGLLGLFLLMCGYAAIGLFMSSLTSYQVVAAIGTLAVLAVLNMIGSFWQDIALVRDIAYWLSIRGRSSEFINGLICSEDVLYFLTVIALFLSLSISRLKTIRQKHTIGTSFSRYASAFIIAIAVGYISSRPIFMFYHDATDTKTNTLTKSSQDILNKLDGKLTINTYVNILEKNYFHGLPKSELRDISRFKQYLRFKPNMKIKYFRYYAKANNPSLDKRYPELSDRERMIEYAKIRRLDSNLFMTPQEIDKIENLKPEGYRFVRTIVKENGDKSFLRVFDDMDVHPSEAEISAAFKRIAEKLPKVGFIKGHGERSSLRAGDRHYSKFAEEKPFRYSLVNQGFDFEEIRLDKEVPQELDILVLTDMRIALNPIEKENLDKYIAQGGNLLIAGEPGRQEQMNPVVANLGVEFMPGRVVMPSENFPSDFIRAVPTASGAKMMYQLNMMLNRDYLLTMPGTTALKYTEDKGFKVTELFVTDTSATAWNEIETTNFTDDTVTLNKAVGESLLNPAVTAIALNRNVGEKEQKIVILGDADCISNGEISIFRSEVKAANYNFIMGAFFWMSNDQVPVDVRRPTPKDRSINLGTSGMKATRWILIGLLPFLMIILYTLIWIRRRGR